MDLGEFRCNNIMHHFDGKREPDYYYKSENTNTVFTAVPPKAVLSKCTGSQMTEAVLVPIAYTFFKYKYLSSYTWGVI